MNSWSTKYGTVVLNAKEENKTARLKMTEEEGSLNQCGRLVETSKAGRGDTTWNQGTHVLGKGNSHFKAKTQRALPWEGLKVSRQKAGISKAWK